MKNVFTGFIFISIFLIVSSWSSRAHGQTFTEKKETSFYSDFYVLQVDPMLFKITYRYPVKDRVQMRILDEKKNVIFTEVALVYKKYQKIFDLSNFNDGQYTFELNDGEEKFKHSIHVETKTTRTVTAVNNHGPIVVGF